MIKYWLKKIAKFEWNQAMNIKNTQTLLGIDPGTRFLGYGWIEIVKDHPETIVSSGCGTLTASATQSVARRLGTISIQLEEVFARTKPASVTVEKVFLGKSIESAFVLGQARGMVLTIAGKNGCEIFEAAPMAAKKSVTGNGHSTKEEVRTVLVNNLNLDPKLIASLPFDATDALALAYQTWRRTIVAARLEGSNLPGQNL